MRLCTFLLLLGLASGFSTMAKPRQTTKIHKVSTKTRKRKARKAKGHKVKRPKVKHARHA